MTVEPRDLVKVAVGSLTQVELWHGRLSDAGIVSRVVGDNLTGGLGTALSGSVELWVHGADVKAAEAEISRAATHHHREPESHPVPPHGHPESDQEPDRSRGPVHGAPPHRPLPS